MGYEEDLKTLKVKVTEDKVVVGSKEVLRGLRAGTLSVIYMATNCPTKSREDIKVYGAHMGVNIIELTMNNEELGIFCKKNYFIGTIAILA